MPLIFRTFAVEIVPNNFKPYDITVKSDIMTHQNLNTLVNLLNNYNIDDAKQSGKYQVDFDIDTFPYEGHVEFSVIVRFDKILPSPLMMSLTEFVWTANEEIDWFLGSNKVHIQ